MQQSLGNPCLSGTPAARHAARLPCRLASSRLVSLQHRNFSASSFVSSTPSTSSLHLRDGRAVAARAAAVDVREPWWDKGTKPNMKTIDCVEDLLMELASGRDKLIVVDFFARWCGSCKALYPKLCRLSEEYPDMLLLKVNFDNNKQLCKALDVKVLPFFQFYRGGEGRVAAFSASVAKVQRLREALAEHSPPRCSLGTSPVISELSSLLKREEGKVVPGPAEEQQSSDARQPVPA